MVLKSFARICYALTLKSTVRLQQSSSTGLSDMFCLLSFDQVSADFAYLSIGNKIIVLWAIDADGLSSTFFLWYSTPMLSFVISDFFQQNKSL